MTKELKSEFDTAFKKYLIGSHESESLAKVLTDIEVSIPASLRLDHVGFSEIDNLIARTYTINKPSVNSNLQSNEFKLEISEEETHNLYLMNFTKNIGNHKGDINTLDSGDYIFIPMNEFYHDHWLVICEPDGLSFLSEKDYIMWDILFKELEKHKWVKILLKSYDKVNQSKVRIIHGYYKLDAEGLIDYLLVYDFQNIPKDIVEPILFENFNLGQIWLDNKNCKYVEEITDKGEKEK